MIHYSNNCWKVVSAYLGHIQIGKCDIESIVLALMAFLPHNKFDIENLAGIGNDNSYVMAGKNNGVYVVLKKVVPSLILIKCACHSVIGHFICRLKMLTKTLLQKVTILF